MLHGTATLSDAGTFSETPLRSRPHNHDLTWSEESSQVFIGAPKIQEQCKTCSTLYSFNTILQMPQTMGSFYTSTVYAQDSPAVRAVSASTSPEAAFSVGVHSSLVADVGRPADDVFDVPIDDNFPGKEVAV